MRVTTLSIEQLMQSMKELRVRLIPTIVEYPIGTYADVIHLALLAPIVKAMAAVPIPGACVAPKPVPRTLMRS